VTDLYARTRLLAGDEGVDRLRAATVAVCGLGGVGSYAFEALARAGVGRLIAIDADVVDPTNANRQLFAFPDTVGRRKAELAAEHAVRIRPDARVTAIAKFIDGSNAAPVLPAEAAYAIDAIDTLSSKVELVLELHRRGCAFVSCMGAARRLDPSRVRVADIGLTEQCPLARRMRHALRARGIRIGVRCVFSDEPPAPDRQPAPDPGDGRRRPFGSLSYMPALLGFTAAGVIINDILNT
jgi:tRNA A37 threonylcarbamoyladenosine dehydratase